MFEKYCGGARRVLVMGYLKICSSLKIKSGAYFLHIIKDTAEYIILVEHVFYDKRQWWRVQQLNIVH